LVSDIKVMNNAVIQLESLHRNWSSLRYESTFQVIKITLLLV